MNTITLLLSYLSVVLVIASGEQQQETTAVPSSSCDCTLAEFENLQNNLESCLSGSAQLNDDTSNLKAEEAKWTQEKKELHILINGLQKNIDDKVELEVKSKQEKEELGAKIKSLQTEIESMKNSNEGNASAVQTELAESKENMELCQSNLEESQTKYDQVNGQLNSYEETLATMKNELVETKNTAEQCHSTIEDNNGKYAKLRQKLDSYETKQSKIANKHSMKVKELRDQISTMNTELEQKKKSYRTMQDRYHDAKEGVTGLESQLRMMHHKAQRTYVNTTLVKEDTMNFLYKNVDKSISFAEDVMTYPKVQSTIKKIKSTVSDIVEPVIPIYKKKVSPQIELIGNKMKDIDAIEGVRLLVISLIEQGSAIGLNYFELTKDNKFGSRRFQIKAMKLLGYTKNNTEYIVHTAFQLFVAFLGYKFLRLFVKLLISSLVKMVQGKKSVTSATKKIKTL